MAQVGTTLAEIENVLMRAGQCVVTVLPKYGGKIASIRIGERELLQAPLAPIAPRTRSMTFDTGDASGWDECLPSVAACKIETDAGVVEIPDHGDLWRMEWVKQGAGSREQGVTGNNRGSEEQGAGSREQGVTGNSRGSEKQGAGSGEQGVTGNGRADAAVTLIGTCFSLPLELERKIELSETGGGWRLDVNYVLRNTGQDPVPWSWAAHPLFAAEQGDRIVLPKSIRALKVEGSGGGRLGKAGTIVNWPHTTLAEAGMVDLSVAGAPNAGVGDKLFTESLGRSQNWCALERPSAGVRIRMSFDSMATQYLGLWICYGGWPERPGPKQMCVAMEPSTAPVDSLAVTGSWSRVLAPGETFSWPMEVEIERIER